MSIEKVRRKGGVLWRVRWRDDLGNPRSRVMGSKRDAELRDADITRRKRMGELARMDAGKQSVVELAEEWWAAHTVNLDLNTQKIYASIFDKHLLVLWQVGGRVM